jgi:hypothetical protein
LRAAAIAGIFRSPSRWSQLQIPLSAMGATPISNDEQMFSWNGFDPKSRKQVQYPKSVRALSSSIFFARSRRRSNPRRCGDWPVTNWTKVLSLGERRFIWMDTD